MFTCSKGLGELKKGLNLKTGMETGTWIVANKVSLFNGLIKLEWGF